MPSHFATVPHSLLAVVTPEPVNSWLGLALHLAGQEGRAAPSSLHLLGHSPDARGVWQGGQSQTPANHQLQLTEDGERDGGVLEMAHAVTSGAQVVTRVRPVLENMVKFQLQEWLWSQPVSWLQHLISRPRQSKGLLYKYRLY